MFETIITVCALSCTDLMTMIVWDLIPNIIHTWWLPAPSIVYCSIIRNSCVLYTAVVYLPTMCCCSGNASSVLFWWPLSTFKNDYTNSLYLKELYCLVIKTTLHYVIVKWWLSTHIFSHSAVSYSLKQLDSMNA